MNLGVVVIGRNEGQRLIECLNSIQNPHIVYVDSGSTDNSIINAEKAGAICINLDLSTPFTAARARNAGLSTLTETFPHLEFVFFIDGDCAVHPMWTQTALDALNSSPKTAAVCGRRRERHPNETIYNTFCDIEWNTPIGRASACGGDAIYRVSALKQAGGFDPLFIAGEEPELCFRIRQLGYHIDRLDTEMTLHDANMTKAYQWWKRNERSGNAFLLGWLKHGTHSKEQLYKKDVRRIVIWAVAFYLSAIASIAFLTTIPMMIFLCLLIIQTLKIHHNLKQVKVQYGTLITLKYAFSLMVGKLPQFNGVVKSYLSKKRKKELTLVEYK